MIKIKNFLHQRVICITLALVFFFFFWISGIALVQASGLLPDQEIEAVESLVQVGKYRLNFKIIRGENYTVLLEAGGGMDSREWNKIAPELAHRTGATIVSYDRAGFGKSDLPETPLDMREEVGWLWQGLKKLELEKNLILVGHSFGGWVIRLFSSEHPEAVKGMVFVDPFTNEIVDLLGVEYLDNHPMAGKIPFDTSHPEKLTRIQRALVRMVGGGLGSKIEIMHKTSIPSDIPVLVITSGKPFLPKKEEQEAWRVAHEQFVSSIKGATLIVAEDSDHMIPQQQPELIIESVIKVIQSARLTPTSHDQGQSQDFPVLTGPYLGQRLPGDIPEYFAPGIVTTRYHEHSAPAVSPDGKWIFWSVFLGPLQSPAPQVILYTKQENGKWSPPEVAPFSGQYTEGGPCFSADGKRIYFCSCRPLKKNGQPKDWDIWYVNKTTDGWSKPINIGTPVNSDKDEAQPSVTRDGTLYFIYESKEYKYDLCLSRSRFVNGKYQTPEILGEPINIKANYAWCPCIAPDESFLLFSSEREDDLGLGDIYISFRQKDDTWSKPINLGIPVCSKDQDRFPGLSPDGKILFFSSKRTTFGQYHEQRLSLDALLRLYSQPGNGLEDIYWVDTTILEKLRPRENSGKLK